MNDDVAATVIEALAMRVRSLEDEVNMMNTSRAHSTACEVCGKAFTDGDRFAVRHAHHNHARDLTNQEARTLALEVLGRSDVGRGMRRRAEKIVKATQGAT